MSQEILASLGLDEEDLEWQQLATCKTMDPKYFDRTYQKNPVLRPVIDSVCTSCPVFKECLASGVENKESYVWGGYYLDNGEIDTELNDHKDDDFKKMVRLRLSE